MRRAPPRVWVVWCTVLMVAWLFASPAVHAAPPAVQRLLSGDMAYSDGPEPPVTGWVPMQLPEVFLKSSVPLDRIGWYRFSFELDTVPDEPLVLLVQRVVTTAEFRVNGSLLNAGVHFSQGAGRAGTQMMNWPHWFVLPAGVLRPGRNEVMVRLAGSAVLRPWISGISVGPQEALRGEFLLRDIPQRQIPEALFALMLVSLAFALRFWWREGLPLQARLLATVVLWLAQIALYFFPDVPLDSLSLTAGILVLFVVFHWVLLDLLWRLSGRAWAWFPKALEVGSLVPLTLAIAVCIFAPDIRWLAVLMLPMTVLRALTTAMLLQWAWQRRTWQSLLLTSAELLWFAGPVQTLLVGLGVVDADPFMLTPGNAMPLYVALLIMAAQRLVEQREEAARQREAAVAAERQRMMHDMHDGLGAHLAAAVRMARREETPRREVEQVVQEALNDLRLIIDSLDPEAQSLPQLLGQWRHRIEPRLRALGQQLAWQVEPAVLRPLSPAQALDVLRFVQEATNNALRHARAQTIGVALSEGDAGSELRVFDDGVGFDPSQPAAEGGGRGLASLRRRAERLGARCEVRPGEGGGTVVSLTWPAQPLAAEFVPS
ncbi:sensor histidine kinase [Roseateles cellulosilyticus]|uniref:histidine kinase n=1 Tax=Pelomonas cellulosilytica TaxID=2906762 RepID=A0ABS8XP11_9BURK|nr:sensor histidine kinase [Pelomonas sp. P8]MCE4553030.1 sensor histidine kinase [Pelomonas sp. P8]